MLGHLTGVPVQNKAYLKVQYTAQTAQAAISSATHQRLAISLLGSCSSVEV